MCRHGYLGRYGIDVWLQTVGNVNVTVDVGELSTNIDTEKVQG